MNVETTDLFVAVSVSTLSAYMIYTIWWQSVECMCL